MIIGGLVNHDMRDNNTIVKYSFYEISRFYRDLILLLDDANKLLINGTLIIFKHGL